MAFHQCLLPSAQLTKKNSSGSDNGLVLNKQQAIILTSDGFVHLCTFIPQPQ